MSILVLTNLSTRCRKDTLDSVVEGKSKVVPVLH